jgi:hypothetical protein
LKIYKNHCILVFIITEGLTGNRILSNICCLLDLIWITGYTLADIYYTAIRAFSGGNITCRKIDKDLMKEYDGKVAFYCKAVEEA